MSVVRPIDLSYIHAFPGHSHFHQEYERAAASTDSAQPPQSISEKNPAISKLLRDNLLHTKRVKESCASPVLSATGTHAWTALPSRFRSIHFQPSAFMVHCFRCLYEARQKNGGRDLSLNEVFREAGEKWRIAQEEVGQKNGVAVMSAFEWPQE